MTEKVFETHSYLTLRWTDTPERQHVTLEGERVKTLYDGDVRKDAERVFNETKKHYEDEAKQKEG